MSDNIKYTYQMRKDYLEIFLAWNENTGSSDIYHMILDWITVYKDLIKSKDVIYDILERMESDDSLKDIVADFIYGERYEDLRKEFGK